MNETNHEPQTQTMTRLGKIGRLPREIREKLNQRLADGEIGKGLVDWLNGLQESRRCLRRISTGWRSRNRI